MKVLIKLEIDINPPAGSGFANKAYALLCRNYTKGRDWYDYIWYVTHKIQPSFILLKNAVFQQGPWAGQNIDMTAEWFKDSLENTVKKIDWNIAMQDVMHFLPYKD